MAPLLAKLVAFRLANALLVQTYFNPDEFWQGPEVAHKLVFGYGHETWEWWAGSRIRGYAHPLLYAALYRGLAVLGLDSRWAVKQGPRLLHGVLAAVGDWFLYRLAERHWGSRVAWWALFCQVTSWFTFYCAVRTFSNSVEAVCATIALYYWVWPGEQPPEATNAFTTRGSATAREPAHQCAAISDTRPAYKTTDESWEEAVREAATSERRRRRIALVWVGIAVVMRPAGLAMWLYVVLVHVALLSGAWSRLRFVVGEVLPVAAVVLAVSTCVDRACYGTWTLVILNFLNFNVVHGGAAAYGSHPWFWYITQGLPTVCGPTLPLVAAGMGIVTGVGAVYDPRNVSPEELAQTMRQAAFRQGGAFGYISFYLIVWTVAVFSLSPHKEFRFILPILPVAMMHAGVAFSRIEEWATPPTTAAQWAAEVGEKSGDTDGEVAATARGGDERAAGAVGAVRQRRRGGPTGSLTDADGGEGNAPSATGGNRTKARRGSSGGEQSGRGKTPSHTTRPSAAPRPAWWFRAIVGFVVVSNACLALYLSLIHQRSPISVMDFLADDLSSLQQQAGEDGEGGVGTRGTRGTRGSEGTRFLSFPLAVHFMVPCHGTPYYSHLHMDIPMWFPDCSPPQFRRTAMDRVGGRYDPIHEAVSESSVMQYDPVAFVHERYGKKPGAGRGAEVTGGGGKEKAVAGNADGGADGDVGGDAGKGGESGSGVVVLPLPSHLVLFEGPARALQGWFDDNNFEQVARLFHSHAQGDEDALERHDYVLVFRRKSQVAVVVPLRKT
jgi:hypothetical protein